MGVYRLPWRAQRKGHEQTGVYPSRNYALEEVHDLGAPSHALFLWREDCGCNSDPIVYGQVNLPSTMSRAGALPPVEAVILVGEGVEGRMYSATFGNDIRQ